jgi:hypothetical protein
MTPALTHLVARARINGLLRQAHRCRRAGEVAAPRRLRLAIPHRAARRVARHATA